MRNLVFIVCSITFFASCGSNQQQQQATQAAAIQQKQVTIDSLQMANEKQKAIDSMRTIVAKDSVQKQSVKQNDPVSSSQPEAATTPAHHKKGWSSTAKGAVIGAGAGGITGALVSKHKVTGALIGTALGAGAGAGTGAIIDGNKKKKEQKESN